MSLLDALPPRHRQSEAGDLQKAIQPLLDALDAAHADFVAQLWPQTASWGLGAWETALGLERDESKDAASRRSRIISKLRGAGTTTASLIENVAESFANGQVEVHERPAEYGFTLEFVSRIGLPPGMDDLKAAVEEIKPAHLRVDYLIRYRTYGELAAHTYGSVAGKSYQTLKEGEL